MNHLMSDKFIIIPKRIVTVDKDHKILKNTAVEIKDNNVITSYSIHYTKLYDSIINIFTFFSITCINDLLTINDVNYFIFLAHR